MIASLVIQYSLPGGLYSFWTLLNTLQVTVHMQGIDVKKPGLSLSLSDIISMFISPKIFS
jgi:hypothetical protein